MASVAACLGVAVYGFSPSSGSLDLFSSPAHAQVNNAVGKVAQPIGFADIVERVKPSVISVKVTMKNKATDTSSQQPMKTRLGIADGALLPSVRRARMACLRACAVTMAATAS